MHAPEAAMMHALTPAADLDVSVRARRPACVLDPALLLAAPHALLLAQQLSRSVDLWVCPDFWRLLDASEFFVRSPQRLRAWLSLGDEHPVESVGAAIAAWARWRMARELSALNLYWVGGHQTESLLPEHGPRDIPARFEALMQAWMRSDDCDALAEAAEAAVAAVEPAERPASGRGRITRLPGIPLEVLEPWAAEWSEAAVTDDAPARPARRHDGVLEPAALGVALQAPVLTLAAPRDGDAPGLVTQWAASGLPGVAWRTLHPAAAAAEHQRWWQATVASGAAATVAAASAVGLRLSLVHVVAPSGQLLFEPNSLGVWVDELRGGEDWLDDSLPRGPATAAGAGLPPWWRDAQALWMPL
jgi:hypothetical protein